MLEISFVRENLDVASHRLAGRGGVDLDSSTELDTERRRLLVEADALKHRRNSASQEEAKLKKAGEDAGGMIREMREVGETIKELDGRLKEVDEQLQAFMLTLPNLPHESVPEGKGAEDNYGAWRPRKKQGFVMPFVSWLSTPDGIARVGETLGDRSLLASIGLDPETVESLWSAHRAGPSHVPWSRVWAIFVLAAWCRRHGVRL